MPEGGAKAATPSRGGSRSGAVRGVKTPAGCLHRLRMAAIGLGAVTHHLAQLGQRLLDLPRQMRLVPAELGEKVGRHYGLEHAAGEEVAAAPAARLPLYPVSTCWTD